MLSLHKAVCSTAPPLVPLLKEDQVMRLYIATPCKQPLMQVNIRRNSLKL